MKKSRVKSHFYTEEEKAFLREIAPGKAMKEICQLFNAEFGTTIMLSQIRSALKRYNIQTGVNMQFAIGQEAWNKGMKGIDLAGENGRKTQFKKGQTPNNFRPIGSERISKDGYIEIKVADPSKWQLKHRYIWEQANGPVPKGHCLIFLDNNPLNITLENLRLITRQQLAILNKNKLLQKDPQLNEIALNITNVLLAIGAKRKEVGK